MRIGLRIAPAALVFGGCVLLAGCAVGPDYEQPRTPEPDGFVSAGLVTAAQAPVDATWWRQFRDPLLDELVEGAVRANYSVAAAQARLLEARASRNVQRFDLAPRVTGGAEYSNVRSSAATVAPGIPREYEFYSVGFDATWELDIFGRVRRLNESASAAAQAAEAARDNVVLSVVAELALNYFELRGAQNRLGVARRNAATQTEALQLVRSRLDAGQGTQLDTSRAEAQVETTLASVPPLEADVARAMHRIEVLSGLPPGALGPRLAADAPMPQLPTDVALGSPADLLRRRPDVRVAERQLHSATARVGVAVADLFPRVTVNGTLALEAYGIDELDAQGTDARRFGPSITWAFLDIFRVGQQIRAADARSEEALADYQHTVLLALEETENALSDYSTERRRLGHLSRAARASVDAADLATQRFEGGVSDFLTTLDAYRTALEAEDLYAESQTDAATALIALYKALGGGWQIATAAAAAGNEPPPQQ